MDKKTISIYDTYADDFARAWSEQAEPFDLYSLIQKYFQPGLTADIGCGIGRDTAWLNAHGFTAIGYDASEDLLAKARQMYPHINFYNAVLPELSDIKNNQFANILCETVIMHLNQNLIVPAVHRLLAILQNQGILYLSWRVTENGDKRDEKGRLYTVIKLKFIQQALSSTEILLNEEVTSTSSGKLIHRIIAKKNIST